MLGMFVTDAINLTPDSSAYLENRCPKGAANGLPVSPLAQEGVGLRDYRNAARLQVHQSVLDALGRVAPERN